MNKKNLFASFVVVLACIFVLGGIFASNVSGTDSAKLLYEDIPGKWTINYSPDTSKGYESRPVMVWSTKCDKETFSVRGVFIQNLTNKQVSALKVGWKFAKKVDGKEDYKILTAGETKLRRLEKPLKYKDTKYLEGEFISLYDVYKPYLKDGKLEGDYQFQIFVSEVNFTDKSDWIIGENDKISIIKDSKDVSFIKVEHSKINVVPAKPSRTPCPKETCSYKVEGGFGYYECAATGTQQYCTNCVTSCCSTVCGSPPNQCQSCN